MKKILFVSSFLSLELGSLCASEKLSQELIREGFNIELVSRRRNKFMRLTDIIFKCLFTRVSIWHVDVYSGQAFIITEIVAMLAQVRCKNLVFRLHGGMLPEFYQSNSSRVQNTLRKANVISTPSIMLCDFFREKGFTVELIPNSLDFADFPFSRNSYSKYSILWVRAFDPIYNPDVAIKALVEVKKRHPGARLTMVGPDKGILNNTVELINKHHLQNDVELIGPIPNNKLYAYYHSHHVFINTTSFESFGVAVMEAASCGIPIVSSSVGEIPFLWKEREEMLMVSSINGEDFAKKISEVFDNVQLAKTLSKNAYRKTLLFDWDNIKQTWINLFNSI